MADEATQAPAETQGSSNSGGNEPQHLTLTQEQFDKTIKDRLERQRQQYESRYAGFDDLKQKAEQFDQLQESRKTEAEKLLGAIEKANQQAQQAADREKQAIERANTTLVRAAVISEASRQQAIDPEAVFALLDHSKLTLGDGDQVNGVEDAVKALLEERSYLAGRSTHQGGAFDGGARQSAPSDNSRAQLNDQIRRAAGF